MIIIFLIKKIFVSLIWIYKIKQELILLHKQKYMMQMVAVKQLLVCATVTEIVSTLYKR